MDLYIIQPKTGAPFFRGTKADARGAARDCGGTWKPIVVPDRKEDRIVWLNGFAGGLVRQHTPCSHAVPAHVGSPVPCPERADLPAAIMPAPAPEPDGDSITPREMIRLINEDRASEAVAGWVRGLDGWRLGVVIDACLARMNKLRGQLVERRD